ncbi:MAG: 2-hydroxychromene-2-carboxylate isomerase [Betaproteobacteria bacterium]|nr:2-hydroxychromene-2-carboxylate isomerase [Betaproteobacteria bacterium]
MNKPIDFYFDFTSPYGYLAATKIGALARKYGRDVKWNPILLGVVFKATGSPIVATMPLKGDYIAHDALRSARFMDVPFRMPGKFPIAGVAPARIACWVRNSAPEKIEAAVLAMYRAYFVDDLDISAPEIAAKAVARAGVDEAAALAATNDSTIKEQLKNEVQAALDRKVCGSPYAIIDGEPFWGADRLDQMDRWLRQGGF